MTTPSNGVPELSLDLQEGTAPVVLQETRPMYWSVRRELWENRSVYIAPLVIAGVFLFGFFISTFSLPRRMSAALALDPAKQRAAVTIPYSAAGFLLILTAFLIGFFYCLDALQGERRDRSILFWKSLPLSDRTAVLSKASIPLVVLPLIVFGLTIALHVVMLLLSTIALLGSTKGIAALWTHVKFMQSSLALFYAVIAIALWHAPIYGWLLLVSGWARRATILWVLLPLLAIGAVERIVFSTSHFMALLSYRVTGWFQQAFFFTPRGNKMAIDPLSHLTPGKFLTTPGLWAGLVLAAAFIAIAIRLRRNREPI
jgi:ABC-2 type transport system permease protein